MDDQKSGRMPPPGRGKGKPGVVIAVGVGKPNGNGKKMPPPGIDHAEAHDQQQDGTGKATAEKALVVREDHHCAMCINWQGDTGECDKVEGVFAPQDACLRYFRHANESDEEPDADEQGGASDMDTDDAMAPAAS